MRLKMANDSISISGTVILNKCDVYINCRLWQAALCAAKKETEIGSYLHAHLLPPPPYKSGIPNTFR